MGVDVNYTIPVPDAEARTRIGRHLIASPSLTSHFKEGLLVPYDLRPNGSPFRPITVELLTIQSLARYITPESSDSKWHYWGMVRPQMEAILEALENFPSLSAWYLPDDINLEGTDDLTTAVQQEDAVRLSPTLIDQMERTFRTAIV